MISIGTDSGARAEDGPFSESKSHPRAWGSFTRILGTYVRDEKLITLEDAIRRFTSRPAMRVGITDRGILRPGFKADITIFNPATVRDVSTYVEPTHYSRGHRARAGQRQGRRIERQNHQRASWRGPPRTRLSPLALCLIRRCTRHNLPACATAIAVSTSLLIVLTVAAPSQAQMAHRLKGSLRTTAGAPIANAAVRADNLTGFRGEQFVGQKDHAVTTTGTGEWNITGIEAGLWLFSTSAPDLVPAVMILPVKFSHASR